MTLAPGPEQLADVLPGRWAVRATNFPMWIRGDRSDPVIEYRLRSASPLVLEDLVEYHHPRQGLRRIHGIDRERRDGGLVWRGVGALALLRSRWEVTGMDGDIAAVRFQRSLVSPAGVDLLVREGVRIAELRTRAAAALDLLGLSVEEFAGLSWLEHRAGG